MISNLPTAIPLAGLEGYRFVTLQVEQLDSPFPFGEGVYHYQHWGSFRFDAARDRARLLVLFDSSPGSLSFALPGVEKDAFQLGDVSTRAIWLTVSRPVSEKVSFFFRSAMPAKLAQVLLLEDESAARPWPPPNPGAETWRKEHAAFSTIGPSVDEGRWRVKLTLEFDGKELPAEFLVACDCAREELEVLESSDSPRGDGSMIEPGREPNSFIVIVRPSSLSNYDHIVLNLMASTFFRIESVERLFRP